MSITNSELWRRRVPHIVATHIAITWMMVEIGDWIVERFDLPPGVTTFAFVAMMTLLPGVALFAWGHGAPGKDDWTRTERVFLPLNLIVAVALGWIIANPETSTLPAEPSGASGGEATETRVLIDETGTEVEFEVARQGLHQRVIVYFWPIEAEAESWLGYGAPWMLAEELTRHPLLSAYTPFESQNMIERMRKIGFPRAINEPRGLQLELANDRIATAFVTGRVSKNGEQYALTAEIQSATDGQLMHRLEETGSNVFELVDKMAIGVRNALEVPVVDSLAIAGGTREHLSDSLNAIELAVAGLQARVFDNDYAGAIAKLTEATTLDPTFAMALGALAQAQRLAGDTQGAAASINAALAHSYKLDSETVFLGKTIRYSIQQDIEKAMKVLEMWTQVHPESPEAFLQLANMHVLMAQFPEKAAAAFERVLELDPRAVDTYLSLSDVYRQQGRFDDAIAAVRRYMDYRSGEDSAYRRMGDIHLQAGDLTKARMAFEQAALLAADSRPAELALVRLDILEGLFADAENRLDALDSDPTATAREFVQSLMERQRLYQTMGRIRDTIAVLETADERSAEFMVPIQRTFQFGLTRGTFEAAIGRNEVALQSFDRLRQELGPPLDRFADFGDLAVHQISKNHEAYRDTLARVEETLKLMPNPIMEPIVVSARATLASWDGDHETATELFRSSLDSLERSWLALNDPFQVNMMRVQYGAALLEAGRTDEALAQVNQAIDVNPGLALAHVQRSKIHLELGNLDEARTDLARAFELWAQADADYVDLINARDYEETLDQQA